MLTGEGLREERSLTDRRTDFRGLIGNGDNDVVGDVVDDVDNAVFVVVIFELPMTRKLAAAAAEFLAGRDDWQ